MALKTFVKVSGINNLSDTRYCAGMGVNQLGFNIEEGHSNYTDIQSFKELSDWVSGVQFVGEIELVESKGKIAQIIEGYELDAIQVSDIELIPEALETGKAIIFYTTSLAQAEEVVNTFKGKLSYVLLEDEKAELENLTLLAQKTALVLGAGLTAESLDDLLEETKPMGLALKGGDEIRPGYKDFDEMADILEALDADEWG